MGQGSRIMDFCPTWRPRELGLGVLTAAFQCPPEGYQEDAARIIAGRWRWEATGIN